MKTKYALMALSLMVVQAAVALPKDGLGVGIMAGEPTGVSLKKWIDNDSAVDAGIAWSFSENDSFHFHVDYLVHKFDLIEPGEGKGALPFYFGLGGRVKLKDDDEGRRGRNEEEAMVGIRVPVGLSYLFAKHPVDLFIEVVPVLDVAPDTDLDVNAALGVRFYF